MSDDAFDVFVSYSRADWRHASDIDSVLRQKSLRTFFDRRNLPRGLSWVRALEQAIDKASAVIILIGPHGLGNTQQYERELALVRQTRDRNFPVVPVLLPGTADPPVGFLQLLTWIDFSSVPTVADAPDQLAQLVGAVQGGQNQSPTPREDICPYRGLDPFREEDASFFVGRGTAEDATTPVGELVRKAREHPFVMVVGRSGSGKSSLVFAGLIPALRRDLDRFWTVVSLRPGPDPLRALAEAFNPRAENEGAAGYASKISDETDRLRKGGPDLLAYMIRTYLEKSEGHPDRMLLYIDQWEELYAQAPPNSETERAALHRGDIDRFIELLLGATQSAAVTLVATVRADFYDPLVRHPQLRSVLPAQQVNLTSMPRTELARTITEPAKKVGLVFDPPSLVDRILDDAGEDEGMLPLLQFALKETWARREGSLMTADAYERSGGVQRAIRTTAEKTFERLSPEDQQVARQLFLRLVTPGEGQEDTRARAAMPVASAQRKIVDQFAGPRTRLLVTGSDRAARPTVEVAHEALIRTWPRLREWIDANREKLRARAAVLQAQTDWEQNDRRDDLLLPAGFQLERARELLAEPGDITVDDIQDYITRSSAREQARIEKEKAAELEDARQATEAARVKADLEQRRADAEQQAREIAEASRSKLARYLVFAVVALAVAIGSAAVAVLEGNHAKEQRNLANEQRNLADQHLSLARTTAEKLIALIPSDLRKVQGIRILTLRRILDDAKQSFDNLKDALWHDPTFQISYANMMTEFGRTYMKAGDLERAVESFGESLKIRQAAAEGNPKDIAASRGISDQMDEIGKVLQQKGHLAPASERFEQALAIRKQIAEKVPEDPQSYRDLGLSLMRRGDVLLLMRHEPAEVLGLQMSARDMILIARDMSGDSVDLDLNLSLIHGSLADVYENIKNDPEWRNSLVASLELLKKLVAAHPDNAEFKRYLGWAHQALGTYHENHEDWEPALARYQDCLSVRDQLVRDDPGDWVYQYDLAWAHHLIGNFYLNSAQYDLEVAAKHYGEAYRIRGQLTETDPNNQRWRKDFALSLETLGDVADRRSDREGALNKYKDAREHFQQLTVLDPNNSGWSRQLSNIKNKISRIERMGTPGDVPGENK